MKYAVIKDDNTLETGEVDIIEALSHEVDFEIEGCTKEELEKTRLDLLQKFQDIIKK